MQVFFHDSIDELFETYARTPFYFFSTKAIRLYTEATYGSDDFLVFGKETAGLPENLLRAHWDTTMRIPLQSEARSLNLSNAVAVVAYEALRQLSFPGLQTMR